MNEKKMKAEALKKIKELIFKGQSLTAGDIINFQYIFDYSYSSLVEGKTLISFKNINGKFFLVHGF